MRQRFLSCLLSVALTGCGPDDNQGGPGDDRRAGDGPMAPVITMVDPWTGPVSGGTAVQIAGSGFVDGATVIFGGQNGVNVTFVSSNRIDVETPAVTQPQSVAVIVTNPDAQSATLADGFTYVLDTTVESCILQGPASDTYQVGGFSELIAGRVSLPGCTDQPTCTEVNAQVGYGDPAVDPTVSPGQWSWTAASFNAAHVGDDDEWVATIHEQTPGSYAYAYRFTADSAATWTYCDLDGSTNGFSLAQTGDLTVEEPPPVVDACVISLPWNVAVEPNQASPALYGRARVGGCTDGTAECPGITAEVGWGATGSNPRVSPETWTWSSAAYNAAHVDDNYDEYAGTVTVADEGSYLFAYRFSYDGGTTWTYCDIWEGDGIFSAAYLGVLTIDSAALNIEWCGLTTEEQPAPPGVPSAPFTGLVRVAGCSDGALECDAVTVQFGSGYLAVDPEENSGNYSWTTGTYDASYTTTDDDRYSATLQQSYLGTYNAVMRVSFDQMNWIYCDTGNGSSDGFQFSEMATLRVFIPNLELTSCVLSDPLTADGVANAWSALVRGEVFVTDCTGGASKCNGVFAEAGIGPVGVSPIASPDQWTWDDSPYFESVGSTSDFYAHSFVPRADGTFAYTFRFSVDAGGTWEYCDSDGSANGFDVGSIGTLTVADVTLGECQMLGPTSLTVQETHESEEEVEMLLDIPGCSSGDTECAGVIVELGHGSEFHDPVTQPELWRWYWSYWDATYTATSEDRYTRRFVSMSANTYRFAFRASGDGGDTWTYCDLDGSANGFSMDQTGTATVTP